MRQGAEGLARQLDAPLVSQENIDLMVETAPSTRPESAVSEGVNLPLNMFRVWASASRRLFIVLGLTVTQSQVATAQTENCANRF